MKYIPASVSRAIGRQLLITQKYSPNILFVAGVGGVITSSVMASRATLRLEEELRPHKDNMQKARTLESVTYTEEDRRRDIAILYARQATAILKLYGPAIIVGGVGIACLVKSHNILTKRNAALTAAYTTIEKAFSEYRKRVREEYGDEKDRDLMFGSEEVTVVDTNAKGVDKLKKVKVAKGVSQYARFFDVNNPNWVVTPEYNLMFIRTQQQYANDKLKADGHYLLNDVYDSLGMSRTKDGCVVGWVWDPEGNLEGDNYVDFGIFDDRSLERVHNYVTGREGEILLDFNVDGLVFDKI